MAFFYFKVTGGPAEIYFPLESFRISDSNSSLSYFQGVIGFTDDNLSEVSARLAGELILEADFGDGVVEIFRSNFDDFDYHTGPFSGALTLKGSKTTSNPSPAAIAVDALSEITLNSDGARVFRFNEPLSIKAGDNIIYQSETISLDRVTQNSSVKGFSLIATEQV